MPWTPEQILIAAAIVIAVVVVVAAVLVARARAARRRAEGNADTVRRAARRLRRLVDANPVPMVVIDHESNVLLWTRAAEELFGWAEQEVLGLPAPMVTTDKLAEWRRVRDAVADGTSLYGLETMQRSRDGRLLEVALSAVPTGRGEIVLVFTAVNRPAPATAGAAAHL